MGSCLSTSKSSASGVVVEDTVKNGTGTKNNIKEEGKYCYNDTSATTTPSGLLPIPKYNKNGNGKHRPSDIGSSNHSAKSRHDNIIEWRDELGAEGDLAQAVVHIEVRSSRFTISQSNSIVSLTFII